MAPGGLHPDLPIRPDIRTQQGFQKYKRGPLVDGDLRYFAVHQENNAFRQAAPEIEHFIVGQLADFTSVGLGASAAAMRGYLVELNFNPLAREKQPQQGQAARRMVIGRYRGNRFQTFLYNQ